MKKTLLAFGLSLLFSNFYSQEPDQDLYKDSVENTFTYTHGTIPLRNGIGSIVVPEGFKYLDEKQANRVLVDLLGNPPGTDITMGLILPENQGVMRDGYVFNIQYDEIGYVKDDDADDINYDELLTSMQKEAEEENVGRKKEGYEPISIIGWASKPFYDSDKKILHWAKEIKFGTSETNTLNYNVRILGRKGVLVLNAIATTDELALVKKDVNKVLDIVKFNEGYKYKDFDPSIDQVAAWTIGGLVAGKILAKVGILAIVAKFGKVILFALFAVFAGFRNKIGNLFRRKKKTEVTEEPLTLPGAEEHKEM